MKFGCWSNWGPGFLPKPLLSLVLRAAGLWIGWLCCNVIQTACFSAGEPTARGGSRAYSCVIPSLPHVFQGLHFKSSVLHQTDTSAVLLTPVSQASHCVRYVAHGYQTAEVRLAQPVPLPKSILEKRKAIDIVAPVPLSFMRATGTESTDLDNI